VGAALRVLVGVREPVGVPDGVPLVERVLVCDGETVVEPVPVRVLDGVGVRDAVSVDVVDDVRDGVGGGLREGVPEGVPVFDGEFVGVPDGVREGEADRETVDEGVAEPVPVPVPVRVPVCDGVGGTRDGEAEIVRVVEGVRDALGVALWLTGAKEPSHASSAPAPVPARRHTRYDEPPHAPVGTPPAGTA